MAKGRNYSILVGIKLDPTSVQQQLDEIKTKTLKVKLAVDGEAGVKGLDDSINTYVKDSKKATEKTDELAKSTKEMGLTYHQANAIMSKSIEIIGSMLGSVFELDDAIVSLKKVSDLSGESLDNYVQKLTEMGQEVGRTGKPKVRAGMYRW